MLNIYFTGVIEPSFKVTLYKEDDECTEENKRDFLSFDQMHLSQRPSF